jgi:predicted dehydrogenase
MDMKMEAKTSAPPALVIGYGSIGRRHAHMLTHMVSTLAIVNRRESIRVQASQELPDAIVAESLEALDHRDFSWQEAAVVIASWGPSHAALFHALADRGVRRVLCEKPMAASVQDAQSMAERAATEGIFFGLNHTIRYARLAPALQRFASRHDLGAPVAVVVRGGASCLLTNGIHWIDCATELFEKTPRQVVSTAYGDPINPRSPDLMLYGGTAVWRFDGAREAVITFSNRSSVFPDAQIYYRDAVVQAGYVAREQEVYLDVSILQRDRAAVAQFPSVTRTSPAATLLAKGQLPDVRPFHAGLQAAAHELLFADTPTCPAAVGVTSVSSSIGALVSAREGIAIDLPLTPDSQWGQEHWPLS